MDEIIVAIKQLLQNSVDQVGQPLNDIKVIYDGDPQQIPEDNFPVLVVKPSNSEYQLRGSRYDEKIHNVQILLLYNPKQFYGMSTGASQDIEGATWAGGTATFTVTGHGYVAGDKIRVVDVDPTGYNDFFTITAADTNTFDVAIASDPGTYSSGGSVYSVSPDTIFGEKDARLKIGDTNSSRSTKKYTVCGTIQNNTYLPYTSGGTTTNMADLAKVTAVDYVGINNARGFFVYEIAVGVEVRVIGDRLN